eukprot:Skav229085  [mRNA]  locus=scaffold2711:72876:81145:+ [translate_table: standard]
MPPPENLAQSFGWAHHCLRWLQEQGKGEYLLQPDTTVPTSSWFSGYSCPEWACTFISSARKELTGASQPAFTCLSQFELKGRARRASAQFLPPHTCQHIDIRSLLSKENLKELEACYQGESPDAAEKSWKALKGMSLVDTPLQCSRHLQNCEFSPVAGDISGSQCIHYSPMGKKVDGQLLKQNGPGNILLQLYCKYHCQRRTPILFHENVVAFETEELTKMLEEGGYVHIAHIKTYDVYIQEDGWEVDGSPETVYTEMRDSWLKAFPEHVTLQHVVWLDDPMLLREEMLQSFNNNCTCGVENVEKVGEKVVRFVLAIEYWEKIKSGTKSNELRSKTPFWDKRLENATHVSFARTYSDIVLPKKPIQSISIVPATDAEKFGGPKADTDKFKQLFKGSAEIYVIKFQPYTEEEVEGIPDKHSKALLESLQKDGQQNLKHVEVLDPQELFKPDPKEMPPDPKAAQELKFKDVQLPQNLLTSFIETAWRYSPENEFMGWLTGKLEKRGKPKKPVVVVDGLFCPRQEGNQWSVREAGDEYLPSQMLHYMEKSESYVVGWIHSHPTFNAFLSSVDLHTHYSIQSSQAHAVAIVIDKNKEPRVMRMTETGMEVVKHCEEDPSTFHEHNVSSDKLFVDIPYNVNTSGKNSKLTFFDQNSSLETLGKKWQELVY